MLRITIANGHTYTLRLNYKPDPIILYRMVKQKEGVAQIHHKDGFLTLDCSTILIASYEDESAGAPWEYGDCLS